MKDKMGEKVVEEFVALKSKLFSELSIGWLVARL